MMHHIKVDVLGHGMILSNSLLHVTIIGVTNDCVRSSLVRITIIGGSNDSIGIICN